MGSADIYIYDTAGTTSLDDDSGHWAQSFTTNDASEIQVGRVCSLLEDRSDGSLWIGTDAGILVAPRPWETDNGAIHVMRPKVSRNDNYPFSRLSSCHGENIWYRVRSGR